MIIVRFLVELYDFGLIKPNSFPTDNPSDVYPRQTPPALVRVFVQPDAKVPACDWATAACIAVICAFKTISGGKPSPGLKNKKVSFQLAFGL
jgi:hypothetical protein